MFTLQEIESSPLSPMSDLLSDLSNSSSPPAVHQEQENQYVMAAQEQQHVEVPFYGYVYPMYYQPFEQCYLQSAAPPQEDIYYSPSYPQPQPQPQPQYQSISQPYKNLNIEGNWRKKRVPYTPYQLDILKEQFEISDTLSMNERNRLAQIVDLTPKQIKHWFNNRRAKIRNDKKQRERMEAKIISQLATNGGSTSQDSSDGQDHQDDGDNSD